MRKFKNVKGYAIGGIIGASLMFSAQGFAAVGDSVTAVFAQFNLVINGQVKTMDTVPLVYNGTSYLPVRDISNLFGYDVTYKADSRTIVLNSVSGSVYIAVPATVTPTPQPTVTPVASGTPSPTVSSVGISQVYYSASDVHQEQHEKGNLFATGIKEGQTILTYNRNDFIADVTKDYYYDKNTDYTYYSENFLLQILTKDDLNSLSKYSIDRNNKTVTKIQ